ncbi:ribonuclease H-like superfamily protein [Striga asiatica]|uniref:Ribonuclease H-like superfamily protein n=1 Tax=Striga asiatica TaxID=4170 RepID=A0A5A7PTW2_STRAF|nr:ribonuclease H-like superfamily protein [Striga asiatica]
MPVSVEVIHEFKGAAMSLYEKSYGPKVEIKDGASLKLSDYNWVPGIRGRRVHLKEGVAGEDICVQELLDGNRNRWNTQRVRELVVQEDCEAILQIQGLDLMVRDKWRWELGVQGKFSISSSYAFLHQKKLLAMDLPEGNVPVVFLMLFRGQPQRLIDREPMNPDR